MNEKKPRKEVLNPKPETLMKVNICKKLIEEEYDIEYITRKIGYKDKATTLSLLRQFNVHIPRDLCCYKDESDEKWFAGKADPSGLTPHELERAKYLGITPERWAWLKTCPRGGHPASRKFDI